MITITRYDNFIDPSSCAGLTTPRIVANPNVAHRKDAAGEVRIVGNDCTAVTTRDVLDGIETKASHIAERSHLTPPITGTEGVCGIFHNPDLFLPGKRQEFVHLTD